MLRHKAAIYAILLFLNVIFTLPVYAYDNLTCAKQAVIAYYDDLKPESPYITDVDKLVKNAERVLNRRVSDNKNSNHPAKLAMVLDIDDTSLSHYFENKMADFANNTAEIDRRYHQGTSPAILPILRLYNEAIQQGVAVFFISSRKPLANTENLLPYTTANLYKAGFSGWTNIYLPQSNQLQLSTEVFKTGVRKQLTEQGYTIILNIGDQEGDLAGGYAEVTEKLPNRMYTSSGCLGKERCS